MEKDLEKRLDELKVEFESGQRMLNDLEVRQANLRNTLHRISGAIQVLEEFLNQEPAEEQTPKAAKVPKLQKVASG
jgi:predicted nuclease with TOPRIM domain